MKVKCTAAPRENTKEKEMSLPSLLADNTSPSNDNDEWKQKKINSTSEWVDFHSIYWSL